MKTPLSLVPDYPEDTDKAAEFLRMALPLMSQHGAPVNPTNYAIWYEYVSGNNKELNVLLDKKISVKDAITQNFCQKLYSDHVLSGSPEKFEKVGSNLKNLVDKTLLEIKSTSEKASTCNNHFTDETNKLTNTKTAEDVRSVVYAIMNETKQLADLSQNLQLKLTETNDEVQRLRGELDTMKEAADTDALTGMLNRRAFDQIVHGIFQTKTHKPAETYFVLIDLDRFKRINDAHGHLIGDKVLRYTATLLKQFVIKNDAAARYGGDKMAMLLLDTTITRVNQVAERICDALSKSRLQRKDNGKPIGQVTVSIGISKLRHEDDMDSFLHRAESALHLAKENGRNQVVADDGL